MGEPRVTIDLAEYNELLKLKEVDRNSELFLAKVIIKALLRNPHNVDAARVEWVSKGISMSLWGEAIVIEKIKLKFEPK